ncbi:hypothetical protein FBU30_006978 [Linnemannia zychae]|nr:hypothetical protein FBU30_006978 [Linnemannia zychae]
MEMNKWYGTVWRSERNAANPSEKHGLAGLYMFKKTIVHSILCYIPDDAQIGMDTVEKAMEDFKKLLKDEYNSCSIASYYKLLPKRASRRYGSLEEKEKGKGKGKK